MSRPATPHRRLRLPPRLRRLLRHEWSIATLGAITLAIALNAGALADPAHTLPRDVWDPSLLAYLIAWGGHALGHDPAGLWDLNTFYPAPYSLAYSDAMLGYAPFALVGTGPEAAVLRYNVLFIGAHALVLFGGYALARQLGLRPGAAALVGVALAVPPWRLAQTGHLQVLSAGGMFLALAMLARGHGVRWLRRDGNPAPHRPPRPRSGANAAWWAFAGWLVAAWQVSIGFGLGVPFLYLLLGCVLGGVVVWAIRRSPMPASKLLVADAAGGLILAAVALLLARPYLRVLELYPYARRDAAWVALYSPPPSGLFTAPAESTLWGSAHASARAAMAAPGEMALLPGFALIALAVAGLFRSAWPRRVRVGLGLGALAFAVLCLGTHGPANGHIGYLLVLQLPGFEAIRTPGRLIVWATLLLALLAGGFAEHAERTIGRSVARVAETVVARRRVMSHVDRPGIRAALLAVPILLVFVEGVGSLAHAPVPPAPPTLSTVEAPYLVLPTHEVMDMNVMLWSTDRFADTVNGGSGLVPTEQRLVREAVAGFPDERSVSYLHHIGVRSVVVLPYLLAGTPLADAAHIPIDGLRLTRRVYPDVVVFTLDP